MENNSTLFPFNSFFSRKDIKEKVCCSPSDAMQQAKDELCPGNAVISNIINFSKSLIIEKSDTMGLMEIVLN